MMAQLVWRVNSGLNRLGLPGVVGLGLLVSCVAAYLSAVQPAQHKLAKLQQQARELRERGAKLRAQQAQLSTPEAQLASFYRFFPPHADTPDLLAKLYAAAQESGIALEQGEYRLVPGKDDKLVRYQITLPVRGSYPQVRKFLARLLTDLPAASVDSVSIQRQKIGDSTVESQIKMTLYLGGGKA